MGFADRLAQDCDKVFFGVEHFEEDLVLVKGSDNSEVELKGVVDVVGHNTGALAENEVNPSLMALADIMISSSKLDGYEPQVYDVIRSSSFNWSVKQKFIEGGMWTLRCTDRETRRRR